MALSLKNSVVLVIGGASGMGRSIAAKAVSLGATVTIASRTKERLRQSAAEIGPGVAYHCVDTTSDESVQQLFQSLGAIDHLLIPGSSVQTGPLKEISPGNSAIDHGKQVLGTVSVCAGSNHK